MNFEDFRLLHEFDDDERDYGTLLANQKLSKYIKDVLKPLFPNYELTSSFMSGFYPTGAELTMSTFGKVLKDSQFYYTENNSEFVHFTSIHNARNIISEGCIYLSGLNTSTDSSEIELNLSAFNNQRETWDIISNQVKEDFLNFSMSPFVENESIKNNNFYNIQNNYFQFGGDFPIGLIFEIDLSNRDNWWRYHLSKIHYSDGEKVPPKFLTELVESTISWSKKSDFKIYKLPNALFPLMAFFKEGNYKIENEVRLIKTPISSNENGPSLGPLFNGFSINSRNQLVKIEKLYFEGPRKSEVFQNAFPAIEHRERIKKQIPEIKLKKILLPTLNFESLSLKNTFIRLLASLNLSAEVNYIEFNNRTKTVEIF